MRYEFYPLKVTKNELKPFSKGTGKFGEYPVHRTSGYATPELAAEATKDHDDVIIGQLTRVEHGSGGRMRYFYTTSAGQELEG